MNFPAIRLTEKQRNYKGQERFVRTLMKERGDEIERVIDIAKIAEREGLGLDVTTVKEILAYENAGKNALREMVSQTYRLGKYILNSMYFLTSSAVKRRNRVKNNEEKIDVVTETIIAGLFGNIATGATLSYFLGDSSTNKYILAIVGINALDGLYEIYKQKRNRIIKENISRLEQIVVNEEEYGK